MCKASFASIPGMGQRLLRERDYFCPIPGMLVCAPNAKSAQNKDLCGFRRCGL